jgi:two-component system, LuxR family, sensor kinase FixL
LDAPFNFAMVWSMIAACVMLLGVVHAIRWLLDRDARADLTFAIIAASFVGVAYVELRLMHAADAAEWGDWMRWLHLPLFGLLVGTAVFTHQILGTGRRWLLWAFIVLRGVTLVVNFSVRPNFNFDAIESIEQIRFLGDNVSVVGEAVTGRWQLLGTLSALLLVAFLLDATVAAWRRGREAARTSAVVVGVSSLLFVLIAGIYAQLVIWDVLAAPFVITPAFIPLLLVMSFEIGRDMMRSSILAKRLHDSRHRLELAAGSADLGLWEWDGRRQFVLATRQARQLFGLPSRGSRNFRRWLERVHPDDAHRLVREIERAVHSGQYYDSDFRIRLDDGSVRWIHARGQAEPAKLGGPAIVRGALRDVTLQRRSEEETHQLRQELAHAGRVSLLGQLSSSLAHELSQPLSAILRNAEAAGMLLESKVPDLEELKAIVTDIQRDDRRARDVIDRLRTLLKRRKVAEQSISIDALMQEVLELVRVDAHSRGVHLEHVPSPGLPQVCGDRVQLSQVLLNLTINAMDAVAGQPAFRRTIVLWAHAPGESEVELCVKDGGDGVTPELARKVFEPFYTTKSTGMGMGLAISRSIAEAHDGSLTVECNEQGGATFRLRLPARKAVA